ncbi:hypothetical protein KY290_030808 [Solanum tuberosum]|uniref:Uncharacterized protein n=1 Tax=Solanum tuberosum TaxID=4113 RepID=A0ABQ7U7K2_SOLTU|nr:hypothetical protein KY290_030808 [Solanum tuberosum]
MDYLAGFNNIKDLRQTTFLATTLLDKSHQSTNTSSPSSGVLGSHPSTLICQISGSIGHQALQCSNRFNHAFVANDLPKSFATMSVGETNDATWYLDSAASAHMTSSEGYVLTIIVT